MKRLWVAAALAPLSFAAMAQAQTTTISNGTTTPVVTTTGTPNVTINSGGSITLTSGTAVTVAVPGNISNAGSIVFAAPNNSSAANNTIGIQINGNVGTSPSSIVNAGSITLTEDTTGDSKNQSIATGPFANGSDRIGINLSGTGPFTGNITNIGTISIVGENSAGISLGTELNGNLGSAGTITVVGGTPTYSGNVVTNAGNVTYGIHSTGKIDGNVSILGTVSATGQNATAVALGEVDGASGVTISGALSATGYRSTSPSTDPNVLAKLNADQTLQGGSALVIGGSVAGGINLTAAVAANTTANTSAVPLGSLLSDGSAPALLIGGVDPITIGPSGTTGSSLEIGGTITGVGIYADVGATAVQIGGLNPLEVTSYGTPRAAQFGDVILSNGIDVTGTVQASGISKTSMSGAGDITGIRIGSGATIGDAVHGMSVSGTVFASVASDSQVATGGSETSITGKSVPITVTALAIDAGGNLSQLTNNGVITAQITGITTGINFTAQGGTQGQAIAINDQSGTLSSITNTGVISATITPIVDGQSVDAAHSDAVAMYLANTAGNVTVTQSALANSTVVPTITGSVIFGSVSAGPGNVTGAENLDLEAGVMNGNLTYMGTGENSLTINGGAKLTGGLSQAAGGNLNINVNDGTLFMTAPVANTLTGYVGNASGVGPAPVTIHSNSFNVGATGQVVFTIDPTSPNVGTTPQFDVAGNATLANGAKIGATFTSKITGDAETYTLIHAGSLDAGNVAGSVVGVLPYLYAGSITTSATDLDLTVARKTAAELGFNPAQSAALNAIYSQMSTDAEVEAAVLAQTGRSGFLHIYNQFLPDYAGGPFESLATGQRALARAEAEAPIQLQTNQTRGWVQEIGYLASHDDTARSNGYQSQGFGLAGGIEHAHGDSAVGVAAAFITSGVANNTQSSDGQVSTVAIEGGVYWRTGGNGLQVHASANGGYVALGSHRLLLDESTSGSINLLRDAESQWSGGIGSVDIGVSYQIVKGRFSLRPELSADYIALFETGHSEKGGGSALNLAINSRTSTEASAQADVVLGYTFGQAFRWTPQLTVGYRQIITGGPGSTTARFVSGGSTFTLAPDLSDRGGLLARLGVRASGPFADITADVGGEYRDSYQTYDARAIARFLF